MLRFWRRQYACQPQCRALRLKGDPASAAAAAEAALAERGQIQ
jgi:hypothetical protein